MSNLAVLPIIIPLFAGNVLVFLNKRTAVVRSLSKIFALLNLIVVLYATYIVFTEGTIVLETGTWVAPYGIIFVADYLSILIVLTTSIIAMIISVIAPYLVTEQKEKFFFYAFFFFLISGVSGAFLTGDLFNLFAFFEVLLMASYGLIILGGERKQL